MKKTALLLLLAGALLGAGCSDSTEVTNATPAPEPTLTAEQQAAEKAAVDRKEAANTVTTSVQAASPTPTP